METINLIKNIIGDTQPAIAATLEYWLGTCERFGNFMEHHQDKLREKMQKAGRSKENLEAAIFELEIPYLLLIDERFTVEYERYKNEKRRTPDFSVIFENAIEFNVEVKLIREAKPGLDFEKWLDYIIKEVEGISSDVGFAFDMENCPDTPELMERLRSSKDKIVKFIKETMRSEENNLRPNSIKEFLVPDFEDEHLILLLSMPPHNEEHEVYYAGGLHPIFYTQRELRIFGDAICDKIEQMMPNMINILVISTNSSSHEWRNLLEAIYSLKTLIHENNESFFIRKGFHGISDFIEKSKKLSGILFRSIWLDSKHERNRLWLNNQAICEIPEEIQTYFLNMDKGSRNGQGRRQRKLIL